MVLSSKVRKTATRRQRCAIPNAGGCLSISRSFHRQPSPLGVSRWSNLTLSVLMPDDLRHLGCRRRVAAALGADDAVDDGHADTGQVAELHAVQNVFAGRMLCLVHDDELSGAADFDESA